MRNPCLAVTAALVLAFTDAASTTWAQGAYEAIRQEQACPRDREPRSLRQTVVILDEAMVADAADANQVWKRIIVDAADAREVSQGTLGRRERLTILIAKRDGSELVPLFVGCSPNLPADELERGRAGDSQWDRFLGNGFEATMKKRRDDFAGGIARALAQVVRRSDVIANVPAQPGSLLRALQNAGRLADPNLGLPRFILVSPLRLQAGPAPATVPVARAQGFALADRSGVDFGRAEVYLAGASLGDGTALESARTLILGSKGVLAGTRSDGLPRLQAEPVSLRTYAGFIDYVDQRLPVQLRLAATAQGDLVDSWIGITQVKSTATPLGGKMLCRGDVCEIRSDGRFAQVWFPDPQAEPADRAKLPFAGARTIELTVGSTSAAGKISDPKVVFGGANATRREELRFEIQRVEDGQF